MSYSVTKQIDELRKWVGFREGPGNIQPFTHWQFNGGLSNLAWCASFADYCAVEIGGFRWPDYCQCGYKGDAWVPGIEHHARQMGIWKSRWDSAHPGWQAIYNWDGGEDDHVETVLEDHGNYTINIGGNTGDMVAFRQRDKENLVGYAALDLAGQNEPNPTPITPNTPHSTGGSDVQPTDLVDATFTKDKTGTYRLGADGRMVLAGAAISYGSVTTIKGKTGGIKLVMGINHAVSMLVTPTGKGYWILGFDGGIFSFGDAFYIGNFLSYKNHGHPVQLVSTLVNGKSAYGAIYSADGTVALPK